MSASPIPSPAGRRRFLILVAVAFLVLAAAGLVARAGQEPAGRREGRPRGRARDRHRRREARCPGHLAGERLGGRDPVRRPARAGDQHRARGAHPRGAERRPRRPARLPRFARRGGEREEGRGAGAEATWPTSPTPGARWSARNSSSRRSSSPSRRSTRPRTRSPRSRDSSPWTARRPNRRRSRSRTRRSARASRAAPAPSACARAASCSPTARGLVTVTQIDPIQVAFTLPEKELPGLAKAIAAGPVEASITVDDNAGSSRGA